MLSKEVCKGLGIIAIILAFAPATVFAGEMRVTTDSGKVFIVPVSRSEIKSIEFVEAYENPEKSNAPVVIQPVPATTNVAPQKSDRAADAAINTAAATEPIVGTWAWGGAGVAKRETLVFHPDGRITPDNGGKHWWEKTDSYRGFPTYNKRFDNGKTASSIKVYITKDNQKLMEMHAGASYEKALRIQH